MHTPPKCPTGATPQLGPLKTLSTKYTQATVVYILLVHQLDCRDSSRALPGGCLFMKVGPYTHQSGAFLSLETGKITGGSSHYQGHTRICAHAYTMSWQQPLWGEASTCPIPEQGAGAAAHPQPGRPDSGERNDRGGGHSCPGGLTQELEPSRPDLVPLCKPPTPRPAL